MITPEKLPALLVAGSLLIVLSGCNHLFSSIGHNSEQKANHDLSVTPLSRDNLLLSLRHNPQYGLIPYGNRQVLFRDLTKPHPSAHATQTVSQKQTVAEFSTPLRTAWLSGSVGVAARTEPDLSRLVVDPENNEQRKQDSTKASAQNVSKIKDPDNHNPSGAVSKSNELDIEDTSRGCNGSAGGHVRPHDENWLAARDGSNWTIQVVSTRDATEPCIDQYLRDIEAPAAHRHVVYFNDALWNVAVVGEYLTAEAALQAASRFDKPWIRQISEFRRKRCNSVQFMPPHLRATLNQWCR